MARMAARWKAWPTNPGVLRTVVLVVDWQMLGLREGGMEKAATALLAALLVAALAVAGLKPASVAEMALLQILTASAAVPKTQTTVAAAALP